VRWSSTHLPLPVFFKLHVNDHTCMLCDLLLSARELDVGLTLLYSWLNPRVPFVHVVFKLDLCNRGMSFSHIPRSRMAVVRCYGLSFAACTGFCGCMMAWLLIPSCFLVQVSSSQIHTAGADFHVQICTLKLLLLNFHRTGNCFRHCSRTIDRIDLKLFEHVPIIIMHLL